MNLAIRADRVDRFQRVHHAHATIVVQGQVTIIGGRVAPRDGEDGEALFGQVFHHRVLRRQVENIILHDPGRHDQDRFGVNLLGVGRVLDQFDQVIAEDDPAGGDGNVFTWNEVFGADRRFFLDLAANVFAPVFETLDEVLSARLPHPLQNFRIGEGIVRRGEDVQHLARDERDDFLMMRTDARNIVREVVPPLLGQQEGLRPDAKRLLSPGRVTEAVVAGQRLDAAISFFLAHCGQQIGRQAVAFAESLLDHFQLLAWRGLKVKRPVHVSECE